MTTTRILISALLCLLSIPSVAGEFPRFRFLGAPLQPSPYDVVLMNDRILTYQRDHTGLDLPIDSIPHIYHRTTGKWTKLPKLGSARLADWFLQLLYGHDHWILYRNNHQYVIWDVDADTLVLEQTTTVINNFVFVDDSLSVHEVDVERDNNNSLLSISTFVVGSDQRKRYTAWVSSAPLAMFPCKGGGVWIVCAKEVYWTPSWNGFESRSTAIRIPDIVISSAEMTADGRVLVAHGKDVKTGGIASITLESPSDEPSITGFNDSVEFMRRYSSAHRSYFKYDKGINDGLFEYKGTEWNFVTKPPRRTAAWSFSVSGQGWVVVHSAHGLAATPDDGHTWTSIPNPFMTPDVSPWSNMSLADDGTVVLNNGFSVSYSLRPKSDTFELIPGDIPNGMQMWYHKNGHWMVVSRPMRLSDARGLFEYHNDRSLSSFAWNDSVFVRLASSKDFPRQRTTLWVPGATALMFDSAIDLRLRFVNSEQELSNGMTWLGGSANVWRVAPSGRPEAADSGRINNMTCPIDLAPTLVNEHGDSLRVLMRAVDCYVVISVPLRDPRTYRLVQETLPDGYAGAIFRGHDQYGVGIYRQSQSATDPKPDLIYVLDPDMQTYSLLPFEGVDEFRVLGFVYDIRHRVYYALTDRGLYRSDPVVSSVASDVRRPTSDVPLQTTWYNTLGEHVSPPTTPGLYLKIMIDDKGHMVTEKVAIP